MEATLEITRKIVDLTLTTVISGVVIAGLGWTGYRVYQNPKEFFRSTLPTSEDLKCSLCLIASGTIAFVIVDSAVRHGLTC